MSVRLRQLNRGESYILDVPTAQVAEFVKQGKLKATTDYSSSAIWTRSPFVCRLLCARLATRICHLLSVPSKGLAPYLHPGMIIILESSTYPGTTREMVLPTLTEKAHLEVGKEIFLAFSPERVDPGRTDWTTYNTPKVVGGITPACSEVAAAWYSQAIKTVVPVTTTEVAEMAKLLENTFRMINIGLVNELAIICDRLGVDVWEVIDAAATKPFGL